MYTFLPANGVYFSPFGAAFYSPAAVNYFYFPQRSTWYSQSAVGGTGELRNIVRDVGTGTSSRGNPPSRRRYFRRRVSHECAFPTISHGPRAPESDTSVP